MRPTLNERNLVIARVMLLGLMPLLCACHSRTDMTCTAIQSEPRLDPRWDYGALLYSDCIEPALADWSIELERGGAVSVAGGIMDVDVPAGATIWFRHRLSGPVLIAYEARAVDKGGPNDRVSDINCFWMATDPRSPGDLLARPRSGAFADYHPLRTYYVGLGGNYNSTTRMRRYIGDSDSRPLLPEHDLSDTQYMLRPNDWQTIRLVAFDGLIQYYRDGDKLFELIDERPYTSGWFAFRTTKSHVQFRSLRVYRLIDAGGR